MGGTAKDVVRTQFREAVARVLEHHFGRPTPLQPIPEEHAAKLFQSDDNSREMLSSIIRLEGTSLGCCLILMADADTIESLAPDRISRPRDYIAELSNLVLGALKNSLCGFGVVPRLGLPIAVQGRGLELLLQLAHKEAAVAMADSGPVVAILHYSVEDETWQKSDGPGVAEAGSVCLFE